MSDESKTHHDLKNALLNMKAFINYVKDALPNTEENLDIIRNVEESYLIVKDANNRRLREN